MEKVKNEYDYTEEALKRNNLTISGYSRTEGNGIIKITYDVTDRVQGMGYGTAVGAGTGFAVALGGAALTTVFPPAGAALAIYGILGAPVTGAAVGAAVGSKNSKVHFFEGDSKVLLGDSRTEAAKTADQKAVGFFKEGKFAEAKAWFRTAFAVCESDQEPQYKKKMTEAEAEDYNYQGEEKMKQGDHAEAKRLFELAIKAGEKYDEKHKFERNFSQATSELERTEGQTRQAEEAFNVGVTLWEKASTEQSIEEMMNTLHQAERSFKTAQDVCPSNKTYERYEPCWKTIQAAAELISEGIALKQEGDCLIEKNMHQAADERYTNTTVKYQEAKRKLEDLHSLNDETVNALTRLASREIGDETMARARTAAADAAVGKAKQYVGDGNFKEANIWYTRASLLTLDPTRQSLLREDVVNTEAETINQKGEEQLKLKNYAEAQDLFAQARSKCSGNYNRKSKFDENFMTAKTEVEKISAQDIAGTEAFLSGETLWHKAWEQENDEEDAEAAEESFKKAQSSFQTAANLRSDNEEYKKWSRISSSKVEGNRLFNEGIEMQEEGDRLSHQEKHEEAYQKLQEAYNKYNEAKTKFKEGEKLGDNERFNKCLELVSCQMVKTIELKNIADRARFTVPLSSVVRDEVNNSENKSTDDDDLVFIRDA